jgi:hypothetical protein
MAYAKCTGWWPVANPEQPDELDLAVMEAHGCSTLEELDVLLVKCTCEDAMDVGDYVPDPACPVHS